jgi:hypothetical protein
MRSTHRTLLVAGAALAAAFPATPLAAKDDPAPAAVANYLESLEIAPGIEHRLVVIYPVLARGKPLQGDEAFRLAGVASPDLLAVGRISPSAKTHVEAVSLAPEPMLVLEGDVFRTPTSDQVVTADALLKRGKPAELQVTRTSRETPEDATVAETVFVGEVLPSPLRYLVMTHAPGAAVRVAAETWADDVKLATPRRSPAELGEPVHVATRYAEYRKVLAQLPRPLPGSGRELVGVVALVDGVLASFETFSDAAQFRQAWPKLLTAIAAEAVVLEARQNLLAEDLAASADPDRFVAGVKQRLLGLFAARSEEKDVPGGAKRLELTVDAASVNLLLLGAESRIVHFVLVTDPARRDEKPDPEDPNLAAAARKARQTEEEKRLLERRGGGGQPQPSPPKPPDPPTPPEPR